jgi:hypothetical protein
LVDKLKLLTDQGSASLAKIEAWVATLRAGVPKVDGNLLPPCNYNLDNLKWSGKGILNSMSLILWETVKKDLGVERPLDLNPLQQLSTNYSRLALPLFALWWMS